MDLMLFITVISIACFLQGIIGFGFAIIAVPIILIFLTKETAVASILVISLVLNGYLARKIKSQINYRLITGLFLSSLLGMPIGVYILQIIPVHVMKILAGSLAVIFTFIIYFVKTKLSGNKILTFMAGFVSGLLNTSTGMSGPPVALFLSAGKDIPKNIFRDTLATFFFFMSSVSIILLINSRVIAFKEISYGLAALPFVFIAGSLGNKLSSKIPINIFRILTLGMIMISGLYSIYSGLFPR